MSSAIPSAETVMLTEAVDKTFMIVCGAMVFSMMCGFSFLESGSVRKKNAHMVFWKITINSLITTFVFWLFGFAIAFGSRGSNDFIGGDIQWAGSRYTGRNTQPLTSQYGFFTFQCSIAMVVVAITGGSITERTTMTAHAVHTFFMNGFIYPIIVYWVWGNGWLFQLGYRDFTGSGVVHCTGAFAGLAGLLVIGNRYGRYKDEFENVIEDDDIEILHSYANVITRKAELVEEKVVSNNKIKTDHNEENRKLLDLNSEKNTPRVDVPHNNNANIELEVRNDKRDEEMNEKDNDKRVHAENDGEGEVKIMRKMVKRSSIIRTSEERKFNKKNIFELRERVQRSEMDDFVITDLSYTLFGGLFLWMGFIFFNAGSSLIVSEGGAALAEIAAMNTFIAGIGGASICYILKGPLLHGKFNIEMRDQGASITNAYLAGMVANGAGMDHYEPWAAFVVGLLGGLMYVLLCKLFDKLKIDDPVEAFQLHGGGGTTGTLVMAFFNKKNGIFYGNPTNGKVLGWQIAGWLSIVAWTFTWSIIIWLILKKLGLLRLKLKEEILGYDYIDFKDQLDGDMQLIRKSKSN